MGRLKKMIRRIGSIFFLVAISVIIYQCFIWVRSDSWPPMPIFKAILWVVPDRMFLPFLENTLAWKGNPDDWSAFQVMVLSALKKLNNDPEFILEKQSHKKIAGLTFQLMDK